MVSWLAPDAIGGTQRYAAECAKGLAARGHELRVVAQQVGPGGPEVESRDGFEIRRFPVRSPSGLGFYADTLRGAGRLVREALRDFKPDVVHVHQLVSAVAAARALARHRTPLLVTHHFPYFLEYRDAHEYHNERPLVPRPIHPRSWSAAMLRRMDASILARAGRIVCLSEYVRGLLREHFSIDRRRVEVLPGGVDTARFVPRDRQEARRRLGLEPDARWLVTVRRLEPRMGLEALIGAFAYVAPAHKDLHLAVVGDGALAPTLRYIATKTKTGGRIRFAGRARDEALLDWYAAADWCVLPTRALEGFGLATVEALSCGRPVCATRIGGTPEILESIDPRWLVPEATPEALAEGLERCLSLRPPDPASLHRRAAERYDWSGVLDRYEEILRGSRR